MAHLLKLYGLHIKYNIKAQMQYRVNFVTGLFTNFYAYFLMYTSIWIITNKFKMIDGWDYNDLILLSALNLFSYSIASTFLFDYVYGLERYINDGRFDRVLVRPIFPMYSMIFDGFSWSGIGQILVSCIFLGVSVVTVDIDWSLFKAFYFVASVIGAVLIQSAALIFFGSLSFWLKKSFTLTQILFINFRTVINYPISIYGTLFSSVLTFILPWAFINFYPAAYLLDKPVTYPKLYLLTPVLGVLLFTFSILLTRMGIRKYNSVGS
ncbi:ABC transporter permease [Paenibacillus aurantiacus]|uniref:ABC transporter permease n=1 Tax=Paenibacillus aurantiacus TaxID=1936118 RepID=A0ABV5KYA4_9BACL